jgi:hypothetical protein
VKITRFEDLDCWREARKLVKMVYDAIRSNEKLEADLRFSGQFSAAAVSSRASRLDAPPCRRRGKPTLQSYSSFPGSSPRGRGASLSNIAEGFSQETDKEFSRGLWISKGSAAEVQSLSYAGLDQEYLSEEMKRAIYDQAEKVASLVSGMLKYLQKSSPHSLKNRRHKDG